MQKQEGGIVFEFLKKKKPENPFRAIMNESNADYANFVRDLFDGLDSATKAHVLVAYQNLVPKIWAMQSVAKRKNSAFSIDDLVIQCAEQQEAATDELNTRRFAWFLWAALVYRLVTMSDRDTGLRETLAAIWCDIAKCAPFLKSLLPDNLVWKPEEKVWFEFVIHEPEPEMVAWAINHGGPKSIWPSPIIKKLAEEYGLLYSKGTQIMGPVSYIPPRPSPTL